MLHSWIYTVYSLQTYFTYLAICVYAYIMLYVHIHIKYTYIMQLCIYTCICSLNLVSKIHLFNLNKKWGAGNMAQWVKSFAAQSWQREFVPEPI
jgi:phosphatidylserine synthase